MVFTLASSRLKPVPQTDLMLFVGPALAGKASGLTPEIYGVHTGRFPAEAGPTENQPSRVPHESIRRRHHLPRLLSILTNRPPSNLKYWYIPLLGP